MPGTVPEPGQIQTAASQPPFVPLPFCGLFGRRTGPGTRSATEHAPGDCLPQAPETAA